MHTLGRNITPLPHIHKVRGIYGQIFILSGHLTTGIFLGVSQDELFFIPDQGGGIRDPETCQARNPLAAEGQTLLQVSRLCLRVKRGILWQQKNKLFSRSVVFVC